MSVAEQLAIEPLVTAGDLERLSAEGQRFELVYGELIPMAPVGNEQGATTNDLIVVAGYFVRQNKLGRGFTSETGFRLSRDPDTVLAPDWAFIRKERLTGPVDRSFGEIVPDLVLETRSPNESRAAVTGKIALWLRFGVQVVWDLDPVRKVLVVHRQDGTVTRLGLDDELTEPELLPGFAVKLAEIFDN